MKAIGRNNREQTVETEVRTHGVKKKKKTLIGETSMRDL